MLQAFVFEKVGVVVGDLYFLDPNPHKGQEGPEHGVRLELRVIDRGELKSSIYSAVPIAVGQPIWRVDLLESVDGKPGSFNRTHHHPTFTQKWDPVSRVFLRELSQDPLGWLAGQLADLPGILDRAEVPQDVADPVRRGQPQGHGPRDRRRGQHDAGQGPGRRTRHRSRRRRGGRHQERLALAGFFSRPPRRADSTAAITMKDTDS